jgi:hypothetical protein
MKIIKTKFKYFEIIKIKLKKYLNYLKFIHTISNKFLIIFKNVFLIVKFFQNRKIKRDKKFGIKLNFFYSLTFSFLLYKKFIPPMR